MTGTWTWATVTQATPLRIKVDGDTTQLDATTDNLVGSLAVDDRVRVHLHSDGIIVTGVQGGGNRSNPNLLINSNFMVNQEGTASGSTFQFEEHVFDGWKIINYRGDVISWADVGGVRTLTIEGEETSGSHFVQIVEKSSLPAGRYTVSSDIANGVIQLRDAGGGFIGQSAPGMPITFDADGTQDYQIRLYVSPDDSATVSWVKLERGTVATPYHSPLYGDNLRACMRYYETGSAKIYAAGAGAVSLGTNFKVTKRAAPTMAYSTASARTRVPSSTEWVDEQGFGTGRAEQAMSFVWSADARL